MMSTKCVSFLFLVTFSCMNTLHAKAVPYLKLEPKPGYIPVYIREGETPLANINPQLAEAFNEIESSDWRMKDNDTTLLAAHNADGNYGDDDGNDDILLVNDQMMVEAEPVGSVALAAVVTNLSGHSMNIKTPISEDSHAYVAINATANNVGTKRDEMVLTNPEQTKNEKATDIASFDAVRTDNEDEDVRGEDGCNTQQVTISSNDETELPLTTPAIN